MDLFTILLVLLVLAGTGLHVALFVIYRRNYRFATLLHDMLPIYPMISGLGLLMVVVPSVFLLEVSSLYLILVIPGIALGSWLFLSFLEWSSDYSISQYDDFLERLVADEGVKILGWDELDKVAGDKVNVVIRHDIDIYLDRAMRVNAVERRHGVPSLYLFRNNAERYSLDEALEFIRQLEADSLYSVGFHYETISNASGDLERARSLFSEELAEVRQHANILFIAGHGDRHRNQRLVREGHLDLEALGVRSCYYIGHDLYITDAGGKHSYPPVRGESRFIRQLELIASERPGTLVQVLMHADWWH